MFPKLCVDTSILETPPTLPFRAEKVATHSLWKMMYDIERNTTSEHFHFRVLIHWDLNRHSQIKQQMSVTFMSRNIKMSPKRKKYPKRAKTEPNKYLIAQNRAESTTTCSLCKMCVTLRGMGRSLERPLEDLTLCVQWRNIDVSMRMRHGWGRNPDHRTAARSPQSCGITAGWYYGIIAPLYRTPHSIVFHEIYCRWSQLCDGRAQSI
jgi:hypothetical protein